MNNNYQFLMESLDIGEDFEVTDVKRLSLDIYNVIKGKIKPDTKAIKKVKSKENKIWNSFKRTKYFITYQTLLKDINEKDKDLSDDKKKILALTATINSLNSNNPQSELDKLRLKMAKLHSLTTIQKWILVIVGIPILVAVRVASHNFSREGEEGIAIGLIILYILLFSMLIRAIQS